MAEIGSEQWFSVVIGDISGIHHLPFAFSCGSSIAVILQDVDKEELLLLCQPHSCVHPFAESFLGWIS
jgi:hypothetical protein